MYALIVFPY